jgi:polyphosphate kinase
MTVPMARGARRGGPDPTREGTSLRWTIPLSRRAPPNDARAPPEQARARYFNRELSWLAFNRRVLEEACNPAHPLLERLRFLSISGNNLDEFFMVRVAGLKGQQLLGVEERSADGLTPAQQLARDRRGGGPADRQPAGGLESFARRCSRAGVDVIGDDEIDEEAARLARPHFREQIFPVLTPQAIDPAHPFPFIPNKGFSLIFDLKRLSDGEPIRELLMVPATLPRFIRLPGEGGALHRDRNADPPPHRHALSRATSCSAAAPSGSSATATSRSRRKPRTWSATSAARSSAAAAAGHPPGARGRMPDELERDGREGSTRARRSSPNRPASSASATSKLLVEEDRPDLKFPPFTPALSRAHPRAWRRLLRGDPRARTSSSTTPTKASRWWSPS